MRLGGVEDDFGDFVLSHNKRRKEYSLQRSLLESLKLEMSHKDPQMESHSRYLDKYT